MKNQLCTDGMKETQTEMTWGNFLSKSGKRQMYCSYTEFYKNDMNDMINEMIYI